MKNIIAYKEEHIVIIMKYRRKTIYGKRRSYIGKISPRFHFQIDKGTAYKKPSLYLFIKDKKLYCDAEYKDVFAQNISFI